MTASKSIAVILIVTVASLCVLAQTPQPSPNPQSTGPQAGGTITGQVVDENEQGVPYARVQIRAIRPTNPKDQGQTVITDTNGEFVIKGLEPVDYGFHTQAPSYMPGYPDRLRDNGTYRAGDRVRLRLIKGGVVTGKVTDAFGKPVVGVGVRAQMVRDSEGRVLARGNYFDKVTDDRGVYRIYGVWPGTYVVVAGGPNIYVRSSDRYEFELDVPTYAPSSTREEAAEIGVRGGEEVSDVDIRYRGERGRTISGDVTVPSNLHTEFLVTLMTGGDMELPLSATSSRGASRGFVFKGLGDGEYKLIAQSSNSDGEIAISASTPISVRGADVTGVKLTATLLGSVSGRVVLEEPKLAECGDKDHPLAYEAYVVASARENEAAKQIPQMLQQLWSLGEPSRPDRDGSFLLKNLAAGEYYFGLRFHAPLWYVNSIALAPPPTSTAPNAKARSVDTTRAWTNVKGSERLSNLTITIVHGGASLRGGLMLAEGEQVPRGLFVYLVPAEREKANDVLRFFATQVQSNGYIGVANIPPGRYWILAQPGEETPTLPLTTKIRLPNESETRKRLRLDAEAAKNEIELKPCQSIDNFRLSLKPSTQN